MVNILNRVYKSIVTDYGDLIKEGGLYTFFNILDRAVPFFLLPIIIRLISTEEFGTYALFLTVESLMMPIVTLNIYSSISKHYFDDDIDLKRYNATILLSLPLLAILYMSIFLLIPKNLLTHVGLEHNIIIFAIFTSCIGSAIVYTASLLRLKRKPVLYGTYYFTQSVLLLTLLLSFSLMKHSYKMLIYAKGIHVIILFVVSIFFLKYRKEFVFKYDVKWLKRALSLSFPTVLYSLSAFVFVMSDRLLINYFLGPKEVGYYSAVSQIAAIMSVLAGSFNSAWMPWLFENLKKEDPKIKLSIVKVSYFLMVVFLLMGIFFCLIYPFLAKWVLTEAFFPYISVSYPIIMGLAFQAVYLIVSPYVFYVGKTKYNAIIGILVAITNVSLNFILIPRYNIWGASYAYFVSWFMLATLFFYFSNKVYPMPWFQLKFFNKNK
jgi:O-antigen/teichoic acid export membrane protein